MGWRVNIKKNKSIGIEYLKKEFLIFFDYISLHKTIF